jgi:hypothetical protein
MKKLLANKRGEGYINTAVIIIIAVVIGGLLLGGLYLVFAGDNGVVEQVDDNVYDMFNTGGEMTLKHEGEQLLYSYDGETWKEVKITGMDETCRVTKYLTIGEEEELVHLVLYRGNSGSRLCYSLDAKEWVPCVYGSSISLGTNSSGTTIYANCSDGRSYYSSNGVDWNMSSTARY